MEKRQAIKEYVNYLSSETDSPWISTYLSTNGNPYVKVRPERRFRQLVQTASHLWGKSFGRRRQRLIAKNLRQAEDSIVTQLNSLQEGSVAMFASEQDVKVLALPILTKEQVVAGDRPHIKPLFSALQRRRPFWMAQFEDDYSRLLYSDGFSLKVARTFGAIRNRQGKWNLKLIKRIEATIAKRSSPVLLAGIDRLTIVARMTFRNCKLMERGLVGFTGHYDCVQLMRLATSIVEEHFGVDIQKQSLKYQDAKTAGKTTTDLNAIVSGIKEDKIEHIFLASDVSVWGRVSWDDSAVELHHSQTDAHDNDILGLIAQRAYQLEVPFTLLPMRQMPDDSPIAAIKNREALRLSWEAAEVPTFPLGYATSYRPATPTLM